jgi:H/ACA ribonucleoprotein complex non-core subunit NAF1
LHHLNSSFSSVLKKYQLEVVNSGSEEIEEEESSSSEDEETSEESSEEEGDSESGDTSSETESSSTSSSSSDDSDASVPSVGTESDQGNDHNSNPETSRDQLPVRFRKEKAKLQNLTKEVDGDSNSDSDAANPMGHAGPITAHEITLPQVKLPPITEIPQEEPISLLGEVASVIEDVVVIKSIESGIQRVLDTESLLVFEDRKVLGLVS